MQPNDVIAGRYRLLRPIGAGAMGTVWAACHELTGRAYALKIAAVGDRAGRDARELFLREVRTVGALRHRNVVDIADAGEAGEGSLYLAMELLEGESLAQRIARSPLDPEEALAVVAEVCRGLGAAHAAGVVHRDIKPENVFLARGPGGEIVPKLLDFGVSSTRGVGAGAERAGRLYGTPAYMSPEQALGEADVDQRVDLWAAGVVLYEMLTGQRPFDAPSYPALLPIIIDRPHPPLPASIPTSVIAIVDRCLAKACADRYESAEALLDAVEGARAELAPSASAIVVPASRLAAPRPKPATWGQHRGLGLVAGIAGVGGIVAIAAVVVGRPGDTRSASAAAMGSAPAASAPGAASTPAVSTSAAGAASATGAAAPPGATVTPSVTATSAGPSAGGIPGGTPPGRPKSVPAKGRVTKVDSAGF